MINKFVVTAALELREKALKELERASPNLRTLIDYGNGAFLIETDRSIAEFPRALVELDPVFVKHIMPVQAEMPVAGRRAVDFPALLEETGAMCQIAGGETFSVQCRRLGGDCDYNAKDVEVLVGSFFESKGAIPTFSDVQVGLDQGQKIISLCLFRDSGYIGCSTARENLNEHCDEYRVFSRCPREISRAEYKLKEAVRKFGLDITQGRALDLGAAPGGWTKVLADAGMQVVAVDPAALDERVEHLPAVVHIRSKAQIYAVEGCFDLLVNDMNIDPEKSAAAMVELAPHLKPGALALMTCKLVIKNADKLLANIRPILAATYEIIRVKHLYHNRNELTILLARREQKIT